MIPVMKSKGYATLRLPELTGGINARDPKGNIKDNQLSSLNNLIPLAGVLRSRPGFKGISYSESAALPKTDQVSGFYDGAGMFSTAKTHYIKVDYLLKDTYEKTSSGYVSTGVGARKVQGVYVVHNKCVRSPMSTYGGCLNIFLLTENGELLRVYMNDQKNPGATDRKNPADGYYNYDTTHYFAFAARPKISGGLGLFLFFGGNPDADGVETMRMYELQHFKDSAEKDKTPSTSKDPYLYAFERVYSTDFYRPTILINGKGDSFFSLPAALTAEMAPASNFESFNMFYNGFSASFMTDGDYYAQSAGGTEWMGSNSFTIPTAVATVTKNGTQVLEHAFTIDLTDVKGRNHKITIDAGTTSKTAKMNLSGTANLSGEYTVLISLEFQKQTTIVRFFYTIDATSPSWNRLVLARCISNNLIFSGRAPETGNEDKLAKMRGCTWFGGTAGLYGGTRLFLWGNPDEPNVIRWSDVDEPFYFPEGNYVAVGDQTPVTSLQHEANMLVIFKRDSMYYTTYTDNSDNTTAQDVQNGAVVDIAALSAIFPITQIHNSVGCDLPGSIQLCNNRLVWATSGGKVYFLAAASPTSETNVYELSYPVEPLIKDAIGDNRRNYEALQKRVFSADCDGYYTLYVNNKAFLMNYTDSGFRYYYNYAKGEKVKSGISWFYETVFPQTNELKWFITGVSNATATLSPIAALTVNGKPGLLIEHCVDNGSCSYFAPEVTVSVENETDSCQEVTDVSRANINGIETAARTRTFEGEFTTKYFDLDELNRQKRVEQIYLAVRPITNCTVTVSLLSDTLCIDLPPKELFLSDGREEHTLHFRNLLHGVNRFAIKVRVSGLCALRQITLKYKAN